VGKGLSSSPGRSDLPLLPEGRGYKSLCENLVRNVIPSGHGPPAHP
jgi:hypothetical protein